jgi:hypothetical protein
MLSLLYLLFFLVFAYFIYIYKDIFIKESFQLGDNTPPYKAGEGSTSSPLVNIDTNKATSAVHLDSILDQDYYSSSSKNPFGNVLLTEIKYDSERLAAPPSFNMDVSESITENVKKAVQKMNPGIKNTNHQLFGDLYNNFLLDNSNRVFFSTANSRVTNDQGAFGKFLYGYMPSGKESNATGALARVQDSYRYTLY